MKIHIWPSVLLGSVAMLAACLTGCSKMEDVSRQFVERGETIYIAKADSLKTKSGRNRIELSWLLLSDPKVNRYKVYWNNRKDSVEDNVTKTTSVDTVRVLLNNMSEGKYFFEIFLFDKNGHSSIQATTFGSVYGDRYQSSLLTRAFRSITRIGDDVAIDWMPADETLVRVEVDYKNMEGAAVRHLVSAKATLDTLRNVPAGTTLEYRSVFRPDTTAMDQFTTAASTFRLDQ